MKYLVFCILTFLCFSTSYAQEKTLLASAAPHAPSSLLEERTEIKEPNFTPILDIRFGEKDYWVNPSFDEYWNLYANKPNQIFRVKYDGLYGLVYNQIERLANRFYADNLKKFWDNSSLHPLDLESRVRAYRLESSDFGNRYWEQRVNFWDYYPVEKGGAQECKITIGKTYEIFSVGPINVTNTGRVSLSNWRLTVDRDPDDEEVDRDIISTDDRFRHDGRRTIPDRLRTKDYALGIKPPKGNIYTGSAFSISGSININLKLDTTGNNGSALRGELKIIGFPGMSGKPWFGATLRVTAKPFRDEYTAQLMFVLIQF